MAGLRYSTAITLIAAGIVAVRVEVPSLPGQAVEVTGVHLNQAGPGGVGTSRQMGLSHDLSHTGEVDIVRRQYWWTATAEYAAGGPQNHFVPLEGFDIAGPQMWVISSGGNELVFPVLTIYWRFRKMPLRQWTELLQRTSYERG